MNVWGHFKTITSHKLLVMKYCFRIGLYRQGLLHDMSKYAPTEFLKGARYYQGTRSPNNAEREATGLSVSWLHHKGRNKHHFEYWVDYGIGAEHVLAGMPMPRKYIAEMIMDRISASRIYHPDNYTDASPLEYYEKGKDRLWFIHEDTKAQLEYLLRMLAVKGEAYTLHYIRYVYLKRKGKFGGDTDTYLSKPWIPKTKTQ
ncbi:MAG: DUF5662 family protein [Oliverpabstia sp.]